MKKRSDTTMVSEKESQISFSYIQEKAQYFLKVGPDEYSHYDFFELPGKSLNTSLKLVLENGCRQILENKGLTIQQPLTGLGIQGFYQLMGMFHFIPIFQEIITTTKHSTLDRIFFNHRVMKEQLAIVLYNEVLNEHPLKY